MNATPLLRDFARQQAVELRGIDGVVRSFMPARPSGLTRVDLLQTDVRKTMERFKPEPDFVTGMLRRF